MIIKKSETLKNIEYISKIVNKLLKNKKLFFKDKKGSIDYFLGNIEIKQYNGFFKNPKIMNLNLIGYDTILLNIKQEEFNNYKEWIKIFENVTGIEIEILLK